MKTILLIEDNTEVRENTAEILELATYKVLQAENGKVGVEIANENEIDLIICDIMMPVLDGYGVIHLLSKNPKTAAIPFIFLTAKSERGDFRKGMEMGADDYITKPFDFEVLMLKIKAILKRNEEQNRVNENIEFDMGKFHFNPKLRELKHDSHTQTLSPKENDLLKMLAEHKNDLLPREKALKKIWGSDTYFNGRSMDVYIAKLRKYLKDDTNIEIVNIHGNGFRLVAP